MVIFITGGSKGIGSATVKRFLIEPNVVHSTYFDSDIKELQTGCKWHQFDLTKNEDIDACSKLIKKIQPDVLINNAGINVNNSFEKINLDVFNKIQTINTIAPLKLMQAAIDGMKEKDFGRVVNIASIWSIISKEDRASYSASKFALDGITISFSAEYSKNNVLAKGIEPAFFFRRKCYKYINTLLNYFNYYSLSSSIFNDSKNHIKLEKMQSNQMN